MSYDDQLSKELILLSKWQEKANSLNTWLDDMEQYLNNLPLNNGEEEEADLDTTREDFEVTDPSMKHINIYSSVSIFTVSTLIC